MDKKFTFRYPPPPPPLNYPKPSPPATAPPTVQPSTTSQMTTSGNWPVNLDFSRPPPPLTPSLAPPAPPPLPPPGPPPTPPPASPSFPPPVSPSMPPPASRTIPPPYCSTPATSYSPGPMGYDYGSRPSSNPSPASSPGTTPQEYSSYYGTSSHHRQNPSGSYRPEDFATSTRGWGQRTASSFKRIRYDDTQRTMTDYDNYSSSRLSRQSTSSDTRFSRPSIGSDNRFSRPSTSPDTRLPRPSTSFDTRYTKRSPSSDSRYSYSRDTSYADSVCSTDTRTSEGYRGRGRGARARGGRGGSDLGGSIRGDGRGRKRKKPLSQSIPSVKGWTDEEAERAFAAEKEHKVCKNHSLRIQFPDPELNREIVSQFHTAVESVYFQQCANPRFCFVALKDDADPDAVIEEINKIPFGQGFLSAELKKDREEELNIGPNDIDPLTLYVGNLAFEVTKEDMVNIFTKNKRIDIGFARKLRPTRYAFISFRNVDDAIEAFKTSQCKDLRGRSMIIRFRRLHGTVGLPGEPKVQNPSRESRENEETRETDSTGPDFARAGYSGDMDIHELEMYEALASYDPRSPMNSSQYSVRRTASECSDSSSFDASIVKSEPYDYPEWDYEDDFSFESPRTTPKELPKVPEPSSTNTSSVSSTSTSSKISSINTTTTAAADTTTSDNSAPLNLIPESEVKKEPEFITPFLPEIPNSLFPVKPIPMKVEPNDVGEAESADKVTEAVPDLANGLQEPKKEVDTEPENTDSIDPDDNEEEFNTMTDFGSLLDNLKRRPSFMS